MSDKIDTIRVQFKLDGRNTYVDVKIDTPEGRELHHWLLTHMTRIRNETASAGK